MGRVPAWCRGSRSPSDREREGAERSRTQDTHVACGMAQGTGLFVWRETEDGCGSPLNAGGLASGKADSKPVGTQGGSRVKSFLAAGPAAHTAGARPLSPSPRQLPRGGR